MRRGQFVGVVPMVASFIIMIAYMWLVFFPSITGADIIILKLTELWRWQSYSPFLPG